MFIYKITNLVNGKIYIGQTVTSLQERWRHHLHASRGNNTLICKAIRKYGRDSFQMELIVQACSQEELDYLEAYFIVIWDAQNPNVGYNRTDGGIGFTGHHSLATRAKMSATHKGRPGPTRGMKLSEEHKQKISIGNTGKKRSAEVRQKYSSSKLGAKNPAFGNSELGRYANSCRKNTHCSDAAREKISLANSGSNNRMFGATPWNKGKAHSLETRAKLKVAWLIRKERENANS